MFSKTVLWLVFLRLFVAIAMAALGSFAAVAFKKISHKRLCLLISFAAGALLAVAVLDILPEAAQAIGIVRAIPAALSGYLLFWLVTRFLFHICPACAATHTEANFKAITLAMLAALGIHSFMDGLAIYSGYLSGSSVGMLILVAVAYHKLPEGMALTLVARGSGMSRKKAFLASVSLEAFTTFAGGLAGLLILIPNSTRWVAYVLAHVAGGFVFLVVHALLSEVVKHHPRSTILAAILGAASIGILNLQVVNHF